MQYKLRFNSVAVDKRNLTLNISGEFSDPSIKANSLATPKVVFHFKNSREDRRIPIVIFFDDVVTIDGKVMFKSEYTYSLDCIFWKTRKENLPFKMQVNLSYGNFYEEAVDIDYTPVELTQDNCFYTLEIKKDCFSFITNSNEIRNDHKKENFVLLVDRGLKALSVLLAIPLIPIYIIMGLLTFTGYINMPAKIEAENKFARLFSFVMSRMSAVCRESFSMVRLKRHKIKKAYKHRRRHPIKENRITFYSARRNELSGNFEFVYNKLKDDKDLDIQFLYNTNTFRHMTKKEIKDFAEACATSKVIVLDEYTPQIHLINLKGGTKVIQLWHACGAFKTFGFSRIGKPMGSPQNTRMHRSYDYVTVSSKYCQKCHSEGFGIATKRVVPTGIARTDIFFDEKYKQDFINSFYKDYPNLKDKKIILFAPTFRGDVKETAYYPMDLFDIEDVCSELGEDYAIIIKHHPFIKEKHFIPEKYADRVIDLSDNTEINDLLFVSDLIITDYSSLVFEASLVNVPMLFYAYDLEGYIKDRDFYFDFQSNIPGKICTSFVTLMEAIKSGDYESEKIAPFRDMFF
ncbi:MAG: CDP-glycerol glycerophosphotransferase family protein, partial [Ruminococcus sp.]|nr:CDP-glycerol glycerophosphotransferase family protein [Ruminococcus sp.]